MFRVQKKEKNDLSNKKNEKDLSIECGKSYISQSYNIVSIANEIYREEALRTGNYANTKGDEYIKRETEKLKTKNHVCVKLQKNGM
jgi:hypothetical protein